MNYLLIGAILAFIIVSIGIVTYMSVSSGPASAPTLAPPPVLSAPPPLPQGAAAASTADSMTIKKLHVDDIEIGSMGLGITSAGNQLQIYGRGIDNAKNLLMTIKGQPDNNWGAIWVSQLPHVLSSNGIKVLRPDGGCAAGSFC
jgi:hypothetical protein